MNGQVDFWKDPYDPRIWNGELVLDYSERSLRKDSDRRDA